LTSKLVPLEVSVTKSASASIKGEFSISVLLNLYPKFIGAGLNVSITFLPVCNPVPETVTGLAIVFCFFK
jgi:hypothetical protein